MQASKIVIGGLYAIKLENGDLVRFEVSEVVTRRVSNHGNPHDYKSHVLGRVREGKPPTGDGSTVAPEVLKLDPDRILGGFDQYVELVERARAEKAALEKENIEKTEQAIELWRLLYEKAGMPPASNDPSSYKQPFKVNYGRALEISYEGIGPLLNALRNSNTK